MALPQDLLLEVALGKLDYSAPTEYITSNLKKQVTKREMSRRAAKSQRKVRE
jgi:hypothetical protein